MTGESKLRDDIRRYLEELRRRGEPIYYLKTVGGSMQRAGTPDWHITYRGRSFWLEAKVDGGTTSAIQAHELELWKRAGAVTAVVRSVEDVKRILGEI